MGPQANIFSAIHQRVKLWQESSILPLNISGCDESQWLFIFSQFLNLKNLAADQNYILVFEDEQKLEKQFLKTAKLFTNHRLALYPGNEFSPYNTILSAESSLFQRFRVLSELSIPNAQPLILFTTLEALTLKVPHPEQLATAQLKIQISDIIDPYQLGQKLQALGYNSAITVEEPGTFSHKGEIVDIYPNGAEPIRLYYFDDMIENIYQIDPSTYKTIREQELEEVTIFPSPHLILQDSCIESFKSNINKYLDAPSRTIVDAKRKIFDQLREGNLFEDYTKFSSLFFEQRISVLEYLATRQEFNLSLLFLQSDSLHKDFENHLDILTEEYNEKEGRDGVISLLPPPEELYELKYHQILNKINVLNTNSVQLFEEFEDDNKVLQLTLEDSYTFLQNNEISKQLGREAFLKTLLEKCKTIFARTGNIIFLLDHAESKEKIEYLIDFYGFSSHLRSRIQYINSSLQTPFYHAISHSLILTENELFKSTSTPKKKTKKHVNSSDLFADQLSTLKIGDFVIHRDYGIAKYLGLEMVKLGEVTSDFIILEFQQNDKVYLPVYKMNLLQKQASSDASLSLASLRSNKFSQLKAKAKNSAKKLAFDLIRLQAERETAHAFSFSPPNDLYDSFAAKFPYNTTVDQEKAIDNVLDDMQRTRPMDHLVCGDVGFGKTEVAMRAAFKAIEDNKQVAILVPTTVLALQHYNSFMDRYKDFPITIEFLSRFKSTKESKIIKEKLQAGEIDIIIGTHKLLSKDIFYKDLGLVIVDEEQRFGVGHKEKLKLLKKAVDFLTLTATPIPRTLQFTMLGLRDLSLIKTPPPKRQSIKSYVVVDDNQTIQKALNRELSRGGQVFIVHNRVADIEEYVARIRDLVPDATITFAHGQMPEKELETRISAFYKGAYQILVSTTIIESGIDIPNANTMIINRADRFGLSQLHQLRGRIGRSDKKAYAYFIVPSHGKLSEIAGQRLKALQTYSEMGGGFNIATVDLELRGAGDILGAEQSGHLHMIGLELYMELLQETIRELKGETKVENKNIEVQTAFANFIPQSYIQDPSERLKFYKKLSNADSADVLIEIINSLIDIFGPIPQELQELETILTVRLLLQHTGIKSLKVVGKVISLEFDPEILDKNENLKLSIINFFITHPKKYKFTPDYKVIYQHPHIVDSFAFLEFSKQISIELSK